MTAKRILTVAMMGLSLAGAVAPAAADARGWGGRGYHGGWNQRGHGHYRRGGDGVFGAIVGGLVVGGLIAAISGAGQRDGQRDGERDERRREARGEGVVDEGAFDDGVVGDGRVEDDGRDGVAAAPGEDAAVDQCAQRVESETAGSVEDIDAVDRFADGWRVRGTVDAGQRGDGAYRGRDSFLCTIVGGRVDGIRFGSEAREPALAPAR